MASLFAEALAAEHGRVGGLIEDETMGFDGGRRRRGAPTPWRNLHGPATHLTRVGRAGVGELRDPQAGNKRDKIRPFQGAEIASDCGIDIKEFAWAKTV